MSLLMKNTILLQKEVFNSLRSFHPKYKVNRPITHCEAAVIPQNLRYASSNMLRKPKNNILRIAGIGVGIGVIYYTGYYMYQISRKKDNFAIPTISATAEYFLSDSPPQFPVTRSVKSDVDQSGFKITLYQYQTCPFCCKVRALLDYYGFSYDVIEVNSVTHKQTKWTSYRKVPFLVIEQEGIETIMQLKDSSMIISALQSFLSNKSQTLEKLIEGYPVVTYNENGKNETKISNRYSILYGGLPTGLSVEDIAFEQKWRKWVDDVYVHILSPNVYRTMNESYQAFSWFSEVGKWDEVFKTWERLLVVYVGTVAMYFIGKLLKRKYNLKGDVRLSFYDETNTWMREVEKRGKFLGGNEPNLSDLSMYGLLTAIEGCDAFQDLLRNTKIELWFNRMKKAVNTHQGEKYLIDRGPNIVLSSS